MEEGSTRRYLTESNFFDYQGLVNIEKKDRTLCSFISNQIILVRCFFEVIFFLRNCKYICISIKSEFKMSVFNIRYILFVLKIQTFKKKKTKRIEIQYNELKEPTQTSINMF